MADDTKPKLSREQFEAYRSDRMDVFNKARLATEAYRDSIIDVGKKGVTPQTCDKLTTTADAFGKAATAVMNFAERERGMGLDGIALKTEGQMTEVIKRIEGPGQKAQKLCDKSTPSV